jgi:hypothetical protein
MNRRHRFHAFWEALDFFEVFELPAWLWLGVTALVSLWAFYRGCLREVAR